MIKSREEIPPARFAHASELNMSEEELKRTPIVGLPTLTVEVPFWNETQWVDCTYATF